MSLSVSIDTLTSLSGVYNGLIVLIHNHFLLLN
jgi:hypothetical protein